MLSAPRLILALTLCMVGTFAVQAEVTYLDQEGSRFTYSGIKERSPELFGAPSISSDTLIFTPTNFRADADNINNLDITDGALGATIAAKPGYTIDRLNIVEFGDFTLTGSGTAATHVSVAGSLFVQIVEINNMPIEATLDTLMVSMDFACGSVADDDGTWDLSTHSGTNLWSGSLSFDIEDALQSLGLSGNATKVLVTFDNTLLAQQEASSSAFIAKKQNLTITAVDSSALDVPEPSIITLIFLGLAGIGFFRMKRR